MTEIFLIQHSKGAIGLRLFGLGPNLKPSKGLRKLVKDNCDITARINIKNSIESLNVSVALGISLYEMNRS